MKENTSEEVSGIIFVGLNRLHVTLRPEFLILDCVSYVRAMLVSQEDALADLEAKHCNEFAKTVYFLRRTTSELRKWLDMRKEVPLSIPAFARRLRLRNHQINAASLSHYARILLSVSLTAEDTDVPQFIFYANRAQPILYVTRKLRFLAAHTGADILGIMESDEAMALRVKLATSDYILKQ